MEEQAQRQSSLTQPSLCPVCNSNHLEAVLSLSQIPVLANVLWDDRNQARAAARGDVELAFCHKCGHLFNLAFDAGKLEYNLQYENSLHFSPRFQRYAESLAQRLVKQYDLRGKTIIEIGSGKGEFLRLLCDIGGNVGTGFDPSYTPVPADAHPAISFIRDLYTEKYASYQADFVLSRHVLEHIEQPAAFVQNLRRTIGDRKRTVVFTEVPNLGYILRDTAIWDIIYEHFSYFSSNSLSHLYSANGFNVLNLAEAFEGQFLYIETIPRDQGRPVPNQLITQPMANLARQVSGFGQRSRELIAAWRERLNQLQQEGRRAVLWGAGSKGISFLNLLGVENEVEYVIDINPRKRNKYVTGAGQQIVPPEFLKEYRADTVIIMNPIYREEIRATTEALGLDVQFLTALDPS